MELLVTVLAAIALTAIAAFIVIAAVRMWRIGVDSNPSGLENPNDATEHFKGYFDKFGNPVKEGDIVSDGEHAYHVYHNVDRSRIDAYSTTGGLIQNLSPREVTKLEIVGRTLEMSAYDYVSLCAKQGTAYYLDTTRLP